MILPGMNLTHHSADSGTIAAANYEKVFGDVALSLHAFHDFCVRELPTIRAYFVLAFYDKNVPFPPLSHQAEECKKCR
jgi:hypothetical protein